MNHLKLQMIKSFKVAVSLFLLNVLFSANLFAGDLRLGSMFKEHMVLQQKMPLNIWGIAKANSTISISFNATKVSAIANADGKWEAVMPSQKAGGPFVFSVSSGAEAIKLIDVLVGEVWICAGQSNMVFPYQGVLEIKAFEKSAKNIRTFKVTNTVSFKEEDFTDSGWKIENPTSAVAFSFAYLLEQAGNVPVGIIQSAWGSSSIEGWMPRDLTTQLPHFAKIMKDFDANAATKSRIDSILEKGEKRNTPDDIFLRIQPNIIYNAMMKPIAPYTCRGMIWYQGEANTKNINDMLQYSTSLPTWVKRIRAEFKNDNLYFLGVMLPGFRGIIDLKKDGDAALEDANRPSWAWMRESQLKVLELPNTAIATTIDLGEKNNIHPKDKLPIGERLALLAENTTLGLNVIAQGPVMQDVKIKGNTAIVSFQNNKDLKTTDGTAPKAFWLADESGKFIMANAVIKDNKILLTAKELAKPLFVRYAFSSKPTVNLINGASIPAQPFRTDRFKP